MHGGNRQVMPEIESEDDKKPAAEHRAFPGDDGHGQNKKREKKVH